jgi:hypothetical protein
MISSELCSSLSTSDTLMRRGKTANMLEIVKLLAPAGVGAVFGAVFGYIFAMRVEDHRIKRRRWAVGTVIQAELAHLHGALSDHAAKMDGYLKSVTNTVGAAATGALPKLEVGEGFFSVYQGTISEVGLFDTETSYGVVYCYANIRRFMRDQETLISEFDTLKNSTMWGLRVKNLYDQEAALLPQIERIMPCLAQQSRKIPFIARRSSGSP